jgi:hypothetical protein
MKTDYELVIQYPTELMSEAQDEVYVSAVGADYRCGSGAGPLTGGRDLNFSFQTMQEAGQAVARLRQLGPMRYLWAVTRWQENEETGDIISRAVLAAGRGDQ